MTAKKPPTNCSNCGYEGFKNVTETTKQWTGYCGSDSNKDVGCGQQHVTGFPASVITSKKKGGD